MRELVPTQRIPRGQGPVTPLPADPQPLGQIGLLRASGAAGTVNDVLGDTYTDAAVVVHGGRVVFERYAGETAPDTPHLLMSITKSVVSCVVGNLVERGVLSPGDLITDHVPELGRSGYRGASLRNVLDMRSGVDFNEDYTDLNAEVRIIEEAMGWRPPSGRQVPPSMYAYLTTLGGAGSHGGVFDYRSCETDVLGWVCERAAKTRMADLISSFVWAPIGADRDAEITCDRVGTAIHDGGMCATARDLARFGMMLLARGEVAGRQVTPAGWLRESWTVDPDIRDAVRPVRIRAVPSRRVVPQQVLVRAEGPRRRPAMPGHQWPAALRRPGYRHRGRQAVLVAGRAVAGDAGGHAPRLRRGRRGARRHRRRGSEAARAAGSGGRPFPWPD